MNENIHKNCYFCVAIIQVGCYNYYEKSFLFGWLILVPA